MTPLKDLLGPVADERTIRRGWEAIEERLDARLPGGGRARARRRWWIAGGALAAAAALVVVFALRSSGSPPVAGPVALRDGGALPLDLTSDVRLSDGSEIAIAGGRLEVVDNGEHAVHLLMPAGTARFAIQPGGPRRWTIDGGLAQVEVLGTTFTVVRAPEVMTIAVEHGVVLVRGERVPGRVQRLLAGQQLRVLAADEAPRAATAAAPRAAAAAPAQSEAAAPVAVAPPKPARPPAAAPRVAAGDARDRAAPAAPEAPPPSAPATIPVDDALAKADLLRRRGELAAAAAALAQIDPKSAGSQAAIAWFTRARLLIDLDRRAEAAVDLRRAIDAGLPSALEARARARLDELTGSGGGSR